MDMDPVMTMREELVNLDKYLTSRNLDASTAMSILATILLAYADAYSVPMVDITSRLLTAEKLRAIVQGTKH
jgi:hypothetical protein